MRQELIDLSYKLLVYPNLISGQARADREVAHERSFRWLEKFSWFAEALDDVLAIDSERLEIKSAGLSFRTPYGLAAGIDKQGVEFPKLAMLGPSHITVG